MSSVDCYIFLVGLGDRLPASANLHCGLVDADGARVPSGATYVDKQQRGVDANTRSRTSFLPQAMPQATRPPWPL